MLLMRHLTLFACVFVAATMYGQTQPDVTPFISVAAPVFVLNHVRVVRNLRNCSIWLILLVTESSPGAPGRRHLRSP